MKLDGEISYGALWHMQMLSVVARNLEVDKSKEHLSWFEVPKEFTQSLHPILDSYLEINVYCFFPNPYLLTIN
jgi:hypothetical protein